MLRIFFHMMVMPLMLWLERRGGWRLKPGWAAWLWYATGVPLMAVEAAASGEAWLMVLIQSLVTGLFFVPSAYFSFKYARSQGGIWRPFLLYLFLSVIAGLVAAVALAQAPEVVGA